MRNYNKKGGGEPGVLTHSNLEVSFTIVIRIYITFENNFGIMHT